MALFPHSGKLFVDAPELTPAEGGIFGAADVIPMGNHEAMGVYYQSENTHDLHTIGADTATCIAAAAAEPEGIEFVSSEEPIVIDAAVKCWASGGSEEDYAAEVERRIVGSSQREVEQWLWDKIFPARAVDLTPAAGPVKAKLGLAMLQEHAGRVYNHVPTFHFGKLAGTFLASADLVNFDEVDASVKGGAQAVNGAGYFGKVGPGGATAGADEAWLYMTGQIVLRESEIDTYPTTDHETNTRIAYGQRTYLATIDGFVAAIRVTLE